MKNKRRIISLFMIFAVTFTGVEFSNINYITGAPEQSAEGQAQSTGQIQLTEKQKRDAERAKQEARDDLKRAEKRKQENKKATVVKELKSLRTSNSTTYLLSDGSRKLDLYSQNIRFKKNGKFYDYDPTLKRISEDDLTELSEKTNGLLSGISERYAYVNTAGDTKQYFPEELDKDGYVILTS